MIEVKDLAQLFQKAEKQELLSELLQFLFTPSELEDLEKRLELTTALVKKVETQREIAKNHNVSIAKITRGSNELKRRTSQFRTFLEETL